MKLKACRLTGWLIALFITFGWWTHSSAAYDHYPPSTKWRIAETEHFNLIYSSDIEDEAQRAANLLEHYYSYNTKTLSNNWRKITVIIASDSAEANGYVSAYPYSSVFYNTPGTFANSEWFNILSVHEGRHMVQFNTVNSEGRKFYWYVFGDLGSTLYIGAFVPSWFLEGDAVLAETTLTDTGRGRAPVFDLWQRTNELSTPQKKRYSYYRAYFGSYEDNYPYSNYYVLGYHMVTYGRRRYGPRVWSNTLTNMGEDVGFYFDHFDHSLKDNNSDRYSIPELYEATYDELRDLWEKQVAGIAVSESETVVPVDTGRWNGYFDATEDGGRLYLLHSGKDALTGIVEYGEGGSRFVTKVPVSKTLSDARSNERTLSVGGGKALWTEWHSDVRWGLRSYSSIIVYDLRTRKKQVLKPKGKILSAAISHDGSRIAAVEFSSRRVCSLLILDSDSGAELSRFEMKHGLFVYDPAFSSDNKTVAVCGIAEEGSSLYLVNAESGAIRALIAPTFEEHPKTPSFAGNFVLYGSDYSGIDNIYAVDTGTGRRYQVTSKKYGAYFPSVSEDGRSIYFSDYSVKGYSVEKIANTPGSWTPYEKVALHRIDYYKPVVTQEAGRSVAAEYSDREYESKSYTPLFHSFNVHSWSPVIGAYFGLELYSTDYLNTTTAALGYYYNPNEDASSVYGFLEYAGFFPVFSIEGIYGKRVKVGDDEDYISWMEKSAILGVTLPLDFSHGVSTTTFSLSAAAGYTEIDEKSLFEESATTLDDGDLLSLTYSGTFLHTEEGTLLDVEPRWGQVIGALYTHTPAGSYRASQYAVLSQWYFPSLFMHHSINFEVDYERDEGEYRFATAFLYPKGYSEEYFEELFKGSSNYTFPLVNMHQNIWKLFYFKRLKGNIFYDHGLGDTGDELFNRRSTGLELSLEYYPFSNIYIAMETSVYYAHRLDEEKDAIGFSFALNGSDL